MKKFKLISLSLTTLFFIQAGKSFSQEFAPVGAVWHYTNHILPPKGFVYEKNFMTVECTGDTIINGKLCSVLLKSDHTTCSDKEERSFVYEESNKVYWYVPLLDEFTLLYDFNLDAGDSWEVISTIENTDTCLRLIEVDSVSFISVNNETLKVMHVKGAWMEYFGTITERFGHSEYMFPWPNGCLIGDTLAVDCWGNLITELRCYEDDSFGFYQRWDSIDCDAVFPVGLQEFETHVSRINVYPTLTNGFLTIEIAESTPFEYRIISSVGEVIGSERMENPGQVTLLNVQHLGRGMYLLVTDSSEERNVFRFFRR
jgi:hypothetical protein